MNRSYVPERMRIPDRVRRSMAGTGGLVTNGGSLIVNVVVSGFGGLVFWIVIANVATPTSVARATAMVSAILGVLMISQQVFITNVPPLIAASPDPRRVAATAYAAASSMTLIAALGLVAIGPAVAGGLGYLREARLGVLFVLGCLIWSTFAMQDSVLSGIRKGHLVLAENTSWAIARLLMVLGVWLGSEELGVGWIVSSWLVPALAMIVIVNYYLFGVDGPLSAPFGTHRFERHHLVRHLSYEQVTAMLNGVATIAVPAVALTALGDAAAAPLLAAYSFMLVADGAIGSFAGAFAVEVRRSGRPTRNLVVLAAVFLIVFSCLSITFAQIWSEPLMALFGPEYRVAGGAALAVLVLGIPARSVSLIAAATNRVYGRGLLNLGQQVAYSCALAASLLVADLSSGAVLAWCLVIGRCAESVVGSWQLIGYSRRGVPTNRAHPPEAAG